MNEPIIERDPSDPKHKEVNPVLKLALELGPLLVFFFANARGEWLVERFPALATLGGPIFVATALFMVATAIALAASWLIMRTLPIMPLVSGVVVFVFGGADAMAARRRLHQDEADHRQHAVRRRAARRAALRQVAARLCLRLRPSISMPRAGGS